jgi:hypothetical protein
MVTAAADGRRPNRLALIAAGIVALLFLAALISLTVFHTSIDPTEETVTVTLHNDTASILVLKQCGSKCNTFHEVDRLSPGQNVRVNTSSDGASNWWVVSDVRGRRLGCLPLSYDKKASDLVVDVSSYSDCPG